MNNVNYPPWMTVALWGMELDWDCALWALSGQFYTTGVQNLTLIVIPS